MPARPGYRPRYRARRGYLLGGAVVATLAVASLAIGARAIPLPEVARALWAPDPANDLHLILRELRFPRTVLALAAGAALGMAGAIMQAVTRNPLAEPGLLGINAGAAMAVVLGASVLGLTETGQYVWFGMLGAGLAGIAVFLLGRVHRTGTDPVRLVLAGAGISVVLGAGVGLIILNSSMEVLDVFRNWGAGALAERGRGAALIMVLALLAGGGAALGLGGALNALSLGPDTGRALGLDPQRAWALSCLAVMVLAGSATAAAGPIGFVGLVAPHMARALAGPDNRHVLPLSALFAAAMLTGADILGRIAAPPDEVAAGIIAALLGGPVFIQAVRRLRIARL